MMKCVKYVMVDVMLRNWYVIIDLDFRSLLDVGDFYFCVGVLYTFL